MADVDRAAALRERRRQRILQSSEERMKKITGQTANKDEGFTNSASDSFDNQEDVGKLSRSNSNTSRPLHLPTPTPTPVNNSPTITNTEQSPLERLDNANLSHANVGHANVPPSVTQPNGDHPPKLLTDDLAKLFGAVQQTDSPATPAAKPNADKTVGPFVKLRTVLMLITGFLVRLSFQFPFGQEYVQTIFNPFVALEIAIIGYQVAAGMDLGENVKGGIWLSTLVLTGIKAEVIYTYKNVMGAVSAATGDFFIFFFAFISLHLLL